MTREQMVAEFGEPGVENAMVIDLITLDPATDQVMLVMRERRSWGASPRQFQQIEEKINRYLGYALDGFLVEQYPQYRDKPITIRLDCAEAPHGDAVRFVEAARQASERHEVQFVVNVVPPPA
jgi:hypothetical protein